MRKFCINLTIAITIVIAFGLRATAQDTPTVTAAPQYFTLNLPAGVSLISAPLDTGQGLARDSFQGLPPQYPLFYGWNPASQEWVSGDLVPAGLGGGYWVYLPSPATLVVVGQPYSYFTSLTKHVDPGWHLFGVPFQEGIGWADFHLYTSGNPIGLDAAVALGWIDANVITTQGSELQYQTPGQPLLPGVAYWVHTLVPLDLRAERPAGVTPATVSGGTPAAPDASPGQPQLVSGQSSASSEQSLSASVMGWLGAIASFLADAAKGAFQIAEGNFAAAGFEFAAGTFGLVEYGLRETTSPPTDQLTQMDAKLDTLITDVTAISGQLTTVEGQISGLQNWITSDTMLGKPILNADVWLSSYLQDPRSNKKSRQWARWTLAGCDTGNLLVAVCPEAVNPVTEASYNAFHANYIAHPGSTNNSADDFPLWWAYSVVGGQSGVSQWFVAGSTVDALEGFIFHGLTDSQGTPDNGLYAYMQQVFLKSGCTTDVSASGCDLFAQVYLPVEAYFSKAIGDQAQLVEAQAEAQGVLGEKYTAGHPGSGQKAASDLMAQTNGYLNLEAEAFLRVAEQIALYRAADGTMDWNNFGSSDAGQLLARADFVAAQLAGQNYQTTPPPGYVNPPWPSSGVVGRVFYAINEGSLQANQTRGVCAGMQPSQAFCGSPVAQISEDISSYRTPTGDWPYLLWQTSGSGTSILATGTLNNQWKVQRLKPMMSLPLGQYVVNSTLTGRLGANLVVATYDSNYNSVTPGATGGIVFGSLNGIEGSIGKYGLTLGQGPWTAAGGATGDVSAQLSISYTDATDAPGGAYLNVTYPPIPGAPSSLSHGATSSPWVWSTSANIQLNSSSLASGFSKVHVHWPTTVNVNLNGTVLNTSTNPCGSGCGRDEYYSYIKLDQQLLDSKSNAVSNASIENTQCNSSPFNQCNITGAQSLDVGSLALAAATQYTFKASFSSDVDPYDKCFCGNSTWRSAIAGSKAAWVINAPVLTLTKQ